MIEPRLIVCGGAEIRSGDPIAAGRWRIDLNAIGSQPDVKIRIENVSKVFQQQLTPRLVDLLEIAAYVYAADCATKRGEKWTDEDSTEPWGRDFAFVIAVREPDFWGSNAISSQLIEVLNFLSNDRYSFTFVPLKLDRQQQEYFGFGDPKDWAFHQPDRVVMFSGGLDSLAGAVETARNGGKLVLVSHRPVTTLGSRQKKLFNELKREFPGQLIHVPVWINKTVGLGREPTQRTRSFLYAALGTVVAEPVQAGGVRFFENGIVSLNLPVADEVIRARASRTTHPIALHLLQSLCSAVTARDFAVDNPYLFKTKTDVAMTLEANRAAQLIHYTCSCAHLMFKSRTQLHCGRCSQCIDRRFAIAAAGLLAHDSDADYETDVFMGSRKDGPEKSMAVDYVRHGIELSLLSESDLAARFNAELSRAVRYEPQRSQAAEQLISMHKRHGEVVTRVLQEKIVEQADKLVRGPLDASSLLALVLGGKHLGTRDTVAQATEEGHYGAARGGDGTADSLFQLHNPAEKYLEEAAKLIIAKFGTPAQRRSKKKGKLGRRDTVIFAAILRQLEGLKYCAFLQDHGISPKWSDFGPGGYPKSYKVGNPWRKKVQDEKSRAKERMNRYTNTELIDAVNIHLPDQFHEISQLIPTRPTRTARAKLPATQIPQ
jgi:hypothetical protein